MLKLLPEVAPRLVHDGGSRLPVLQYFARPACEYKIIVFL